MPEKTLVRKIAEYTVNFDYSDIDMETREMTKKRLFDTLSCISAAYSEPAITKLLEYAATKSRGNATVIGTSKKISESEAALLNGTLIRYLDWNDTYLGKEAAHPSDNFGPILTVADAIDADGEDIILAAVLAYEIQVRLADAAPLRTNGFDHVNYGLTSATAGVGKLKGLSEDELVEAVNIALNNHLSLRQTRVGELSDWKGIAFANVARNAIIATELAEVGITGPQRVFEGKRGIFNYITGEFPLSVETFGGRQGDYQINKCYMKRYPVCYHVLAALDCVYEIREEHGVTPESIDRIDHWTYNTAYSIIVDDDDKWDPQTRGTADHSLPYCIARAFTDGLLGVEHFSQSKIQDPELRPLIQKIDIMEKDEFTEKYPQKFTNKMRVETGDGVYERQVEYPVGHYKKPFDKDGLIEKFIQSAGQRLSSDRISEIWEWTSRLEQQDSIADLMLMMKFEQ